MISCHIYGAQLIHHIAPLDEEYARANGLYISKADWGSQFKGSSELQNFDPNNPNGLSSRQQMMVRSAIKYWVERHKHVVR